MLDEFYKDIINALQTLKKKSRVHLVTVITILLIITVSYVYYALVIMNVNILCPLFVTTGLHCAFCGGTRMIRAIYHGDFIGALRNNCYLFLSLPLFVMIYIRCCFLYIKKNKVELWVFKLIQYFILGLLVFSVIRNLPFDICDYIRPIQDYIYS